MDHVEHFLEFGVGQLYFTDQILMPENILSNFSFKGLKKIEINNSAGVKHVKCLEVWVKCCARVLN